MRQAPLASAPFPSSPTLWDGVRGDLREVYTEITGGVRQAATILGELAFRLPLPETERCFTCFS